MTVPDLFEPLVGFRAWHVGTDGALVPWSAGTTGTWRPGTNEARCLAPGAKRHRAPGHRCTCGLYGLTDSRDPRLLAGRQAVGAIVAWGDVELHRTGFRAQYARIVALGAPHGCQPAHPERLRTAAARYGVPVVPLGRLRDVALEHGRPLEFDTLPPAVETPRRTSFAPSLGDEGMHGIAVDEHLTCEIHSGRLRVGLTAELRSRLDPAAEVHVRSGPTALRRGDPLVRIGDGEEALVLGAPAGCLVAGICPEPAVAAPWLCELTPTAWDEEAAGVAWGPTAPAVYAESLRRTTAQTGDPFGYVRARWITAHEHLTTGAAVREHLRALRSRPRFADEEAVYRHVGERLRAALACPQVAALVARVDTVVGWRLHAPDADLTLDLRPPQPTVHWGSPPPADAGIVVYASASTADDYFAGRGDLPAAIRRGDIQSRASVPQLLYLGSLTQALHAAYREAATSGAAPSP